MRSRLIIDREKEESSTQARAGLHVIDEITLTLAMLWSDDDTLRRAVITRIHARHDLLLRP